jgi:hypothetical protein
VGKFAMANPNHDPKTGEFSEGGHGDSAKLHREMLAEHLAAAAAPAAKVNDLVQYQTGAANGIRAVEGEAPLDFDLKELPIGRLKPSQSGEDYDNASSRELAHHIGTFGSSGRAEDYAPIAVDENMRILDGNHRHFGYKTAG